jgi:hypothetical protein
MTTLIEPLQIDVIAAPLAQIDRRALSQAWYSALGFSHGSGGGGVSSIALPPRAQGGAAPCRAHPEGVARPGCDDRTRVVASAAPKARSGSSGNGICAERRTRSKLAAAIERRLLRGAQPRRSTVTLEGSSGRIVLMVQTRGARTHMVAVCRPQAREIVARAVAQARYALALRGVPCT